MTFFRYFLTSLISIPSLLLPPKSGHCYFFEQSYKSRKIVKKKNKTKTKIHPTGKHLVCPRKQAKRQENTNENNKHDAYYLNCLNMEQYVFPHHIFFRSCVLLEKANSFQYLFLKDSNMLRWRSRFP